MKFVKFKEAHSEMLLPEVGPVPFYIEGLTAIVCVEFSKEEIQEIKRNGGRFYIATPVIKTAMQPIFIKPMASSPFDNSQQNGKEG